MAAAVAVEHIYGEFCPVDLGLRLTFEAPKYGKIIGNSFLR